ncbi:MAG: hypothetical protein K8S24_05865 [Candidatus Aegiribacteria sp.]|nr:hypothetical protein [Candidatus Aegiribacteria sp.]
MRILRSCALMLVLAFLFQGSALAVTDSGAESSSTSCFAPNTDDTGDGFLTTIFAQNNNFAGNSFDIIASTDLTVVGFDVNLDTNLPSWTVQVWTRAGTADGFEQSATGWTLLGTDVVVGAGSDLPTHVNVGGLSMLNGETVGVIITVVEAVASVGGFFYTNGGPNTYSNAEMSVITYRGLSDGFPPGSVFTYRAWNGTVHYDFDTALDQESWGFIKTDYSD